VPCLPPIVLSSAAWIAAAGLGFLALASVDQAIRRSYPGLANRGRRALFGFAALGAGGGIFLLAFVAVLAAGKDFVCTPPKPLHLPLDAERFPVELRLTDQVPIEILRQRPKLEP
jgi:hypothetical protein